MNPILNVRLPENLLKNAHMYAQKDGYTNMQDLVKSLVRKYTLQKKREELLLLWGSQKGQKISQKKMRELIETEFLK